MAQIIINDQTVIGRSISVINGKVIVDGKEISVKDDAKVINISVQGDVDSIDADVCRTIEVTGAVNSIKTTSGDVSCGDVAGDVTSTSGDVQAQNIKGSVRTVSGDVTANTIGGPVKTVSGSIGN